MMALLILLLALTLIVLATRRSGAAPEVVPEAPPRRVGLDQLLLLPEPARSRAWTLRCAVEDALRESPGSGRAFFLLRELRDTYLPDTVDAYLRLTPAARALLDHQGQSAEALLAEQLLLMEQGLREVQRQDHSAADRLLTQGRFLRERFGPAGELRLEDR